MSQKTLLKAKYIGQGANAESGAAGAAARRWAADKKAGVSAAGLEALRQQSALEPLVDGSADEEDGDERPGGVGGAEAPAAGAGGGGRGGRLLQRPAAAVFWPTGGQGISKWLVRTPFELTHKWEYYAQREGTDMGAQKALLSKALNLDPGFCLEDILCHFIRTMR